jgi:hypothetical protein
MFIKLKLFFDIIITTKNLSYKKLLMNFGTTTIIAIGKHVTFNSDKETVELDDGMDFYPPETGFSNIHRKLFIMKLLLK